MLRLLQSIFGGATQGNYPESLVKAAIERAVDGTDPCLRAVSGYKKKLRPAVLRSIDHVVALIDGLPAPLTVSSGSYGDDPRLKTFFISPDDMQKIFARDQNLAAYLRGMGAAPPQVIALLAMEKQENTVLGNQISGEVVIRDVPQVSVSFDAHRLVDPTGSEEETRLQLKRRAFDHLLGLALMRISIVKTTREKLGRHRELLQAKRNLLERGGWGFNESDSSVQLDVPGLEKQLAEIEASLMELGGDDSMYDAYLNILMDVLGNPEKYLWSRKESLILDSMGIKRDQAAFNFSELTLDELINAEGRRLVIALVSLPGGVAE
jgi:hypothetical protein